MIMNKHPESLSQPLVAVAVPLQENEETDQKDTVKILRAKLALMTEAFIASRNEVKELKATIARYREEAIQYGKAAIPVGTILTGSSKGKNFLAVVEAVDRIKVGNTLYSSLSAAAEGVSGVRRSGWSFWKLPNGGTVKEIFKQK